MIAAALLWLRANRFTVAVGGVLVVLIVGVVLWHVGQAVGRHQAREDARRATAVAEARADARKATADAAAATSDARSKAATAQLERDLKHADDAAPHALPSRARLSAACEWMRQQGADDAAVSRCRVSPTRD